jgi:hypothetical protein
MYLNEFEFLKKNGWVHDGQELWSHGDYPGRVFVFWAAVAQEVSRQQKPGTQKTGGEFQGKDGEWRRM